MSEFTINSREIAQLFDTNPQAMWVYDTQTFAFLAVNYPAIRHYGYSQNEFLGMKIQDLQPVEDVPAPNGNGAHSGAAPDGMTTGRHRLKDGGLIDVETTSHEMIFMGRAARLVLANDITERKRTETAVAQLNLELAKTSAAYERTEAALHASDEKFDKAFKASVEAISITRLSDDCIIDINDSWERILGYTRQDMIGHTADELGFFVDPKEREAVVKMYLEKGFAREVELNLISKNGELHNMVGGTEIATIAGEPCVLLIMYDITERKRAEEAVVQLNLELAKTSAAYERAEAALHASDEKFDKAFKASVEAISITRLSDDRIIDINDSWERILGYTRQDMIGHTADEVGYFVNPKEREAVVKMYLEKGFAREVELNLISKNGELHNMVGGTEIATIAGEPCVLLIMYDITERKRAEEALVQLNLELEKKSAAHERAEAALHASDEKFAKAFRASVEAISITRLSDDIIIDVNDSWARILGYTRQDMIGHTADELGFFVDPKEREAVVKMYLEKGFAREVELNLISKNGELHNMVGGTEIATIAGEPCVLLIMYDITERKRAEEAVVQLNLEVKKKSTQLEAANKELESFSYSVSHDLRSPLRAIDGFSRILMRDALTELTPNSQRYLKLIRDNTLQMGHLVDDLLAFSRLSRLQVNKQSLALDELVRQVIDKLPAEQEGRVIEWHIGELGRCMCDPALLRQVWVNLIANALKYTQKNAQTRIDIGVTNQNGETVFFVKDNGVGFDMKYAHKLFGVFQRLHRAEDYEGTGVGLAIVHRIITRHGGRVWAEAAVGHGATFYFTLGA